MSDRLPPLTALRAFDAAARHLSFAKAADELHVTPAALSYQIKSLEEHLGAPVFLRFNRAVQLTEEGEQLHAGIAPAFVALHGAWRQVRESLAAPHLVVTAGPAFTAKWLAPRLYAFATAHPEVDLRLSASLKLADFDKDGLDVAIRFGPNHPMPGYFVQPIMEEWVTPMMHPSLAAKISKPEDLRDHILLHQEDLRAIEPHVSWARWFEIAGIKHATDTGTRFNQADHAIDAAAAGGGIVLGRISLTSSELAMGRLVAPFDLAMTMNAKTRFICRDGAETTPAVKSFLEWISAETLIDPHYARGRQFVPAQPG